MENLWAILHKPDNVPIVGMVFILVGVLYVGLSQAFRHDKLLEKGEKEKLYEDMMK